MLDALLVILTDAVVIFGTAVTVILAVAVHPFILADVTVYVPELLITNGTLFNTPFVNVKIEPALLVTLIVIVSPIHGLFLDTAILGLGSFTTITSIVDVLAHTPTEVIV
jgi:hypothetical protein